MGPIDAHAMASRHESAPAARPISTWRKWLSLFYPGLLRPDIPKNLKKSVIYQYYGDTPVVIAFPRGVSSQGSVRAGGGKSFAIGV
jgi:hypothetical protein